MKKAKIRVHTYIPVHGTVVPALKTLGLSQLPVIKTTFFTEPWWPADRTYSRGVSFFLQFHSTAPPKFISRSCSDSGLLLSTLLPVGMERFLPSTGGS